MKQAGRTPTQGHKLFIAKAGIGYVYGCAGFGTPAITTRATSSEAGVGKAPRHEIAGEWATVGAAGSMGFNEGHPGTVIEMAATPVRMRIFDQVREAALNWEDAIPSA